MIFSEFNNDTIDLTIDFFGFEQCAPRYGFGPAIRENYILHYIKSGKGKFYYKDESISLEAGDLFLLKPNELTYYQADEEDPWSYYWVGISGSKSEDYFKLSKIYFECFLKSSPKNPTEIILQTFSSIIDDTDYKINNSTTEQLKLLANVYNLLFQLSDFAPQVQYQNATEQLCLNCRHIIDKNYNSDSLSIQEIADQLNVNRSYLTTIFNQKFKISPKEYLNQVRMKRARYLLESTYEPIKFIAYSVGFSDSLYFSKAFKHFYQVSPRDLRKSFHKQQSEDLPSDE